MGGRRIVDKKAGITLTEQQRKFCKYYVVTLNASESYRRAYGLDKEQESARSSSSDLLTKPNIIDYINYLRSDIEEALDLSKIKVVAEHQKMAFSNIARLHNTWITRKEFEELTDDEKACIQEISTKVEALYKDKEPVGEEIWVRVKLYDKQKSLESISKLLGYDSPSRLEIDVSDTPAREEFLEKIRKAKSE